jgi:hypothetical protein
MKDMSGLQTPFDEPAMGAPDPAGDTVSQRGSDPNVSDSGSSALQPIWSERPVSDPSVQETNNSVSGMPLRAARWEPTGTPPSPPDLTDRNPGTIDER